MSSYIRQNPGSVNIEVKVAPTSDLAAVGREIEKALVAAGRTGIRMGGPKK